MGTPQQISQKQSILPQNSMLMNSDHHSQLNKLAMGMGMSNLALKGAGIIHGG